MRKRLIACLINFALAASLCGCWNYRGLDQMDIIVGIAIDFDKEANQYSISYEVADLQGAGKEGGVKGRLVEAQGKTIFDAARNAKRREADKLFFGSAYILVISEEVARRIGIEGAIEWFLQDGECRETMCLALSQQETAKAVLESPEDTKSIVSADLHDIIMEDAQVTASSVHTRLYEAYNMLKSPRQSAVLSALRKVELDGKEICELNGIAVCRKDKLVGFLTPEESKYALFIWDEIKGGIVTLSMTGSRTDDISLEIFGSKTEKSFSHEGGALKFSIEISTDVAIAENQSQLNVQDEGLVKEIEDAAAKLIEKNMADVVAKVQKEYGADIFGFGEMVYKHDLPLWKKLEPRWEELFPALEVEIRAEVHVVNSAFLK